LAALVESVLRGVRRRERRRTDEPAAGGARGGDADIRISYTPDRDGQPDPGEVVWTWVAYEDDPSQGKDRPVVVVGTTGDRLAVVPVSSRGPEGRPDPAGWLSIGSGRWDGEGRTSYANLDRILRVPDNEVRREGATLDRPAFDALVTALRTRHPALR
jgi:hypothetical protein